MPCPFHSSQFYHPNNIWLAVQIINPLRPELNPICYLLALLAQHFLYVNRIRVKSLTLRLLMSYIYIYMEHLFLKFLDQTQRRSTVGRTPLDEWSARRRDLYLTTHDTHNRQISMRPVGFEHTISIQQFTDILTKLGPSVVMQNEDTVFQEVWSVRWHLTPQFWCANVLYFV
jgi:hypothetical protein